jgi:hypothetical protein
VRAGKGMSASTSRPDTAFGSGTQLGQATTKLDGVGCWFPASLTILAEYV